MKYDSQGYPFLFPEALFDWREKEKIRSEINTNYAKYRDKEIAMHLSYGLDDCAYVYFFENRGFDDFSFIARRPL